MGVFVTDANGKLRPTQDILQDITNKFRQGELSSAQYTAAIKILGKDIRALELGKLSAVDNPAFTEATKNIDKLNEAMDRLSATIKTKLVLAFGDFAKAVNEGGISGGLAKIVESLGDFQAEVLNLPTDAIAAVLNLFGANIKDPVGLGTPVKKLVEQAKKDRLAFQAENVRLKKLKEDQDKIAAGENANEVQRLLNRAPAPGAGGLGVTPEATLKAIAESKKRAAQDEADAKKEIELQGAGDIERINIEMRANIAKAQLEISSRERISEADKAKETLAMVSKFTEKSYTDIAKLRSQQNAKIFSEEEAQRQKSAEEAAAEETRINNIIESSKQVTAEQQFQLEAQQRKNKLLTDNLGKSDREKANANAIAALEDERAAQLKRISEIKDLPYADRLAREKELNAEIEKRKESTIQNQEIDKKHSEDFDKAWETAYKNYIDNSKNASEQASQLFKTFTSSFEDNLTKSFAKGKLMWREFLLDMVQQLIRSNIQSLLGTLFGGKSNSGTSSLGGILKGLAGFANGGVIPTNSPVIVGERGPEILMGAAGRTVIPNSGIGGSNVTYNINAVDAMSFKAMVASDPTFLYAVTEQGRRRLPGGMK